MSTSDDPYVYESSHSFDAERVPAAAVYCSDGRFGEHFDEFLHVRLKLPRYDRLAVPGGAACLASHFAAYREEEGVVQQLRFLVETHRLRRVVLIAHEQCGFYLNRLGISSLQIESQQREDMRKAISRVVSINRQLQVDAYFARKLWNGAIRFEAIEV